MSRFLGLLSLLGVAFSGCDSSREEAGRALAIPQVAPQEVQRGDAEIEKLIDELETIGKEGTGFHSTAWSDQFMALDEKAEFKGGILGSTEPSVHPAMRALVQKGIAALPTLLGHLPDARKTCLTVGEKFMGRWFGNEYAPRDRHPDRKNPGLYTRGPDSALERKFTTYTLTVGDLCFVAVGQIVNRALLAVRYQPTLCVVVNSPVELPLLADAVRKDWQGLTEQSHRESLRKDCLSRWPSEVTSALQRLCYFYPEAGESTALELLGRDLYDGRPLWEFITQRLATETSPKKWPELIRDFEKRHGAAAARSIPFEIHWVYWVLDNEPKGKENARKIRETLYRTYDPYDAGFVNSAVVRELTEVLQGVRSVKSPSIDREAMEALRRADGKAFPGDANRIELDELAMECMKRLAGAGYDREFVGYCDRRIKEIEAAPKDSTQRYRLDSLRDWQKRVTRK